MQIFIVGSPLDTAVALDKKRLNKQIIEGHQILRALEGAVAWRNHPCVIQYGPHRAWVEHYVRCLERFREGNILAITSDLFAEQLRPSFHTAEFFNQMKRRLYTKDPEKYGQWAYLGKSDVNWYWSPKTEEIIRYRNGKRL